MKTAVCGGRWPDTHYSVFSFLGFVYVTTDFILISQNNNIDVSDHISSKSSIRSFKKHIHLLWSNSLFSVNSCTCGHSLRVPCVCCFIIVEVIRVQSFSYGTINRWLCLPSRVEPTYSVCSKPQIRTTGGKWVFENRNEMWDEYNGSLRRERSTSLIFVLFYFE